MRRTRFATILAGAIAAAALAGAAPVAAAAASGEDARQGGAAGAREGAGEAAPRQAGGEASGEERAAGAPFVQEGILRNPAHGFQFALPAGWTLSASSTADEMEFSSASCGECLVKILVSAGNELPIEETVRGIKRQIFQDPEAVIVDEEVVRIAREKGYTLIREDLLREPAPRGVADQPQAPGAAAAPPAGKRIMTRYVTLNHAGSKYYLMLKAPRERFGAEDRLFEGLLETFRFKP